MKKFLIASLGIIGAAALASAQTIVSWDVSGHGSPIDSTLNASVVGANVQSPVTLSRSAEIPGSAAGNSFSGSNWDVTATMDVNHNYFSFTVAPAASYQLDLTSLQYNMCGSATAPNNDAWGFSNDGGSTWTIEPTFHMTQATAGMQTWTFSSEFDSSSAVEFRFWAWGTTAVNGGTAAISGTTRISNYQTTGDLILNGTVVSIPEPSTITLIGLGLVGLVAFSRRRFTR